MSPSKKFERDIVPLVGIFAFTFVAIPRVVCTAVVKAALPLPPEWSTVAENNPVIAPAAPVMIILLLPVSFCAEKLTGLSVLDCI